jgi:hypothetical protein
LPVLIAMVVTRAAVPVAGAVGRAPGIVTGVQLDFSDLETDVFGAMRRALVVTPTQKIRVGRDRLTPQPAGKASDVDSEIVARLRTWANPVDVLLLRSWGGDEAHSWGFDSSLADAEVDALGYAIMRDQLAFFRDVIRLGVYAVVATDLNVVEFDAMRRATSRLSRELGLRAKSGTATADDEVDRWILEHLSLWTTRPFDEFVLQGLPELFALVDRHRGRLADLSAARP